MELLLRLRQATCSTRLIKPERLQAAKDLLANMKDLNGTKLSKEEAKELFQKYPTITKTIFRKIQAPIAADKFPNASNEERQVRSRVTQMLQEAIVAFAKDEP